MKNDNIWWFPTITQNKLWYKLSFSGFITTDKWHFHHRQVITQMTIFAHSRCKSWVWILAQISGSVKCICFILFVCWGVLLFVCCCCCCCFLLLLLGCFWGVEGFWEEWCANVKHSYQTYVANVKVQVVLNYSDTCIYPRKKKTLPWSFPNWLKILSHLLYLYPQ